MKRVVVIGHGGYAAGVRNSVEMIACDLPIKELANRAIETTKQSVGRFPE